MGLFRRNKDTGDQSSTDPQMAELGRDYAIARRHKDRRRMNQIIRQLEREHGLSSTDWNSFQQGEKDYDAIPPAYPLRRTKRRK
ncbi:hypothetical protein GCM10027168_05830 [Streptomyces capparidis]